MFNKQFDWLAISLASPEEVLKWSQWEVVLPDTINYRTAKPKQKWLFCESIFWPVKNYECSCGKYKGQRYKGIVCERCGVEVTSSRVRRERMGHIDLAYPVVHIWYAKATPSRIWLLLNLSVKEIEKILYFVKYLVVEVDEDKKKNALWNLDKTFDNTLKQIEDTFSQELQNLTDQNLPAEQHSKKHLEIQTLYSQNKEKVEKEYSRIKSVLSNLKIWSTLLESDYRNIFFRYEGIFTFKSWAESLLYLLKKIDIKKEIQSTIVKLNESKADKDKIFKKLKLLINLYTADVRPEWMIITKLPITPADLRPVVQLDWWKFASSDINYFYRRVLMRNLRLKKMIESWMPDVIKKNEIRLLQDAVNSLFVWENAAWKAWAWIKVYKSITDILSWKEWRFRKNLLWKRVDYSWRSIITPGPHLNLDECGLPIYIAIRIFAPFVISELIKRSYCHTPKQAEKMIEEESPIALKILEEVVKDKYVLLNRAPTLHRLWIQAFKVKLMPWKTIRIHPLVNPAFNADFDWDQMAVHLPLSKEAQEEARTLMSSAVNVLKPASWEPIISHTQDMALWVFALTSDVNTGELIWMFEDIETVVNKFFNWDLKTSDKIQLKFEAEVIETTVWRTIFNWMLPEKVRFVNKTVWKKDIKKVLDKIFDEYGMETVVRVSDDIKKWGFYFATHAAISVNVFDMIIPTEKQEIIKSWDEATKRIHNMWYKWLLTDDEKHRLTIRTWSDVKSKIWKLTQQNYTPKNNIYKIIESWAKWNWTHVEQLSGMKWLVTSPSWEIIELPIKSSIVEWMTPIEYFIAAHGARKWKADTALRTAESGYLTRRLVDSSQDCVIRENDCWTQEWILITKDELELQWYKFDEEIFGRVLAEDILVDEIVIASKDEIINKPILNTLLNAWVEQVRVRSPLTCLTPSWICQKCFGMDLSTREIIRTWSAVWVIASQSLWEPATQLTMRTFHSWWVASEWGDMTAWVQRVDELFEARVPRRVAIVSPFDWELSLTENGKFLDLEILSEPTPKFYFLKDWYETVVKVGETLKKWSTYAKKDKSLLKIKEDWKVIWVDKEKITLWIVERFKKSIDQGQAVRAKSWDKVFKGQILTSWALDVKEYRTIVWDLETQKYIVREIKKVYAGQWQEVNNKYMEVIIKQMFSKMLIESSGDSIFIPWSIVRYEEFVKVNQELESKGKKPAVWKRMLMWLTQIAKETESWLSAASFQETMRVIVDASTRGAIDQLDDLKSNVIVWKLLPIWKIFNAKNNPIQETSLADE